MHFRGNAFPLQRRPTERKCISAIGTFGSSLLRVHLRVDRERGCSSHAPGTPRATPEPPRRPRARRPHGRRLPAGVLLLWGVSCAPRVSAVVPHRRAGRQAACNMHVRVPASASARSLLARNCAQPHAVRALARPHAQLLCMRVRRGLSPGAGVGEGHTRLAAAGVVDMRGPSRMALPVRVPAAELRAFVQGSCSVWGHVF
jgi:hypothetical protein